VDLSLFDLVRFTPRPDRVGTAISHMWPGLLPPSQMRCCYDAAAYCRLQDMSETSLYPAVKHFLEGAGFCVKGEIKGCDAVAVQDGGQLRLAIVEMKLGFNLDLLLQAMDRMRVADEVWLAVPATQRGRDRILVCIVFVARSVSA
jgi:hypothetical protein